LIFSSSPKFVPEISIHEGYAPPFQVILNQISRYQEIIMEHKEGVDITQEELRGA
jgi:hypothetical protein